MMKFDEMISEMRSMDEDTRAEFLRMNTVHPRIEDLCTYAGLFYKRLNVIQDLKDMIEEISERYEIEHFLNHDGNIGLSKVPVIRTRIHHTYGENMCGTFFTPQNTWDDPLNLRIETLLMNLWVSRDIPGSGHTLWVSVPDTEAGFNQPFELIAISEERMAESIAEFKARIELVIKWQMIHCVFIHDEQSNLFNAWAEQYN